MTFKTSTHAMVIAMLAAPLLAAAPAGAQEADTLALDLPAQAMARSLHDLAAKAGATIVADDKLVAGRTAPAVQGTYTLAGALGKILEGSGLQGIATSQGYAIRSEGSSTPMRGASADSTADDIVVTGTRIRGSAPAGAAVIAIDRKAIQESGRATVQDLVSVLPQNFGGGPNEGTLGFTQRNNANANIGSGASINLRGLGTTSTLTLVDGNRLTLGAASSIVDISLIPASAIERIEVLADGASAIYGSDAVAGVVNVRLRRGYEGAETSFRVGMADGFSEVQASQLAGLRWNSGSLMAAYEFYRRDRLGAQDRDYATEDLTRFGGPDYRQAFANPGTITAANGAIFGIPAGQDGRALAPGDLLAGVRNLGDGRRLTDILPRTRRHAGLIALEQDLSSWLTMRLQGFAADRRSDQRYIVFGSQVTVPASNPFYVDPIGTGQPISVGYDFRDDLGATVNRSHVTNWTVAGALEARFGAWRAEAYGNHGVQHEELLRDNLVNRARLAQALADPDPAKAFNLFGDGSYTSAATIDYVRGSSRTSARARQTTAGLKFDGPLLTLPGGALTLAFGGEYREEGYGSRSLADETTLVPVASGDNGYPLARNVIAGFAELRAPLVGPEQGIAGVYRLDLSVAGRIEHYSDFGTTTNPKVGLTWEPVQGLALRGSYGTSFRAPGFFDVRQGPGLSQVVPIPVTDPGSPSGSSNVIALFGNDPGIGPERARTWTAGFDFKPPAIPWLSMSATYFDISYKDRIFNPAVDAFTFLAQRSRYEPLITANPSPAQVASFYASPDFSNPFGIAAGSIRYVIDARNANLARNHLDGIDFDLSYRHETARGALSLGASGSWLFHLTQQLTSAAPRTQALGTIGNPVRYRLRGRAGFEQDGFGATAFVNHMAGYRNTAVAPVEPVASWTTVDLTLSKRFGDEAGALAGTRFALSITNLFDRDPPYVNNRTPFSAAGFDPEQASAVGRFVAVQVTKSW